MGWLAHNLDAHAQSLEFGLNVLERFSDRGEAGDAELHVHDSSAP
jgi:hypothetical protein